MKRTKILAVLFVGAFFVMLTLPGVTIAQAQNVIKLTYASPYGPDHSFSKADKRYFDKIEKDTKGRVKITPYWGGTLMTGADAIDELAAGTADMALISPSAAKAGYDLTKASVLFFFGANQQDGHKVFMETIKKIPELEKEFKGLKVLAWTGGADFQLLTRRPVRKIDDFKGLRIKARGDTGDVYTPFGVATVPNPMGEVYMMIQKNMLDGVDAPISVLKVLKMADVTKYCTMLGTFGTPTGTRAMNINTYNKLPADIRKIFDDNVDYYSVIAEEEVQNDDKVGLEYAKANGVEFINLPKADLDKLRAVWYEKAQKEAKTLDAKGLPGTKFLNEAQAVIKKYAK
ncbi:MAG TPA: TRAP transporter substrate-binding protein DctP [Syntrophorhabdaceae bacterium]|nr:TRAP transporter substrate-binding protein DctP [Syntrophorhabdaceae bacterium]